MKTAAGIRQKMKKVKNAAGIHQKMKKRKRPQAFVKKRLSVVLPPRPFLGHIHKVKTYKKSITKDGDFSKSFFLYDILYLIFGT